VLNFAAVVVAIDDHFAGLATGFELYLCEVGTELEILILRPFFEGVIVALVAVEANTQEGLRDVFGDLARIDRLAFFLA